MAGHLYMKYRELAQESHEEHVRSKMGDMTHEMQGALRYIQEQDQNYDAANRRAHSLREENQAIIDVANGLQIRMLELQDENSSMLEVAEREREAMESRDATETIG